MEDFVLWYLIIGVLLIAMAITAGYVRGLPITAAVIYLAIGAALGPNGAHLLNLSPMEDAKWLEHVTELVVIISLFAAGLKLRLPLRDRRWRTATRLAVLSMLITIALITAFAHAFMDLPLGAAILLGAILAPTDPVLASGAQVESPADHDSLRFSLTGEAGLNDGTAFPFVMLGLGLLGAHDLGSFGSRWFLIDFVWSSLVGIAIGASCGTLASRFATYMKKRHRETLMLDDFLAIGVIALSYGAALAANSYGFLAVFAAGVALRRVERLETQSETPESDRNILARSLAEPDKLEPEQTPALLAGAALIFNEQLERLGEVTTVLLAGSMVTFAFFTSSDAWIVPFLLLVVRPVSVWLGLIGQTLPHRRRFYMAWFGIRGIGSLYYLNYAIAHEGFPVEFAERLTDIVLGVVAASILLHGISITPLMNRYQSAKEKAKERAARLRRDRKGRPERDLEENWSNT